MTLHPFEIVAADDEDLLDCLLTLARFCGQPIQLGFTWREYLAKVTHDELLDVMLAVRAALARLDRCRPSPA